ncbi:helix-turn-helix domain-containing protein [Nocardioides sp. LHG3406-4]|uniref:helix-turn-helix domain-containing protein n=1 Tax=Nocardioides sp. LHG3406-4 TaxID=2804575 RepID=UPI003CE8D7C5
MTHTGSPPVAFSIAEVPEGQRVALWENHNAEALIGLRCKTLDGTTLDAMEINLQLEHLHLARVRGTSHVVERDRALIRRRPAEAIALYFSLAGEAFFYHDDGIRTVKPGQLLLCDADRPFMRGFSHGLEELVLRIPRDVFAQVTGIEQIPEPVVVDFATGTGAHAHALARSVGRATRTDVKGTANEPALLQLVGAVASAALGGRRDDLPAAHRAAARVFVEAHLHEPDLSATRIAAAIGISPRHLSRVFADDGTSVPRYVLGRRLDAARALLQRPETAALTVADVARRCGFTSAAHFSNAFTTRFGERPSDVRRDAVAARAARA